MKRFDGVIFDLDGTLLDTIDDLKTACEYAFEKGDGSVTRQQTLDGINRGVNVLIRSIAKSLCIEDYDFEIAKARFTKRYAECYTDKTVPFEGIEQLIEKLKLAGYKIGVFSNKIDKFVKKLCDSKFKKGLIDCARGETEGTKPKPDPEGAYIVMQQLDITDRKRIIYVGDSDIDVKTAKNAGFYCVGVAWGYKDKEILKNAGADIIANDTNELYGFITEEI